MIDFLTHPFIIFLIVTIYGAIGVVALLEYHANNKR